MSRFWSIAAGVAVAAASWWLVRRLWLAKQGTEAEPPAPVTDPGPRQRTPAGSPRVDPVDEAIAESFPASDPPSFAGARGMDDVHI